MKIELRPYQKEGIELVKQKKNFGIFWQQRLGKTIVAIKAVEDYNKVIFAVPNNTILHWYTEIMNNIFIDNIHIVPKKKQKRETLYKEFNKSKKMWLIVSYDTISQDFLNIDVPKIDIFDYLVLDEAHFLRNTKSIRTKGINKLRINATYALALSGTPAVNSAIDILRIFKFLYPENNYNHRYIYKKRYFHAIRAPGTRKISWDIKPDMVKKWNEFLSERCDIKKVHDYLKWLPRNIEKVVKLEMDDVQRYHYDRMLYESKRIISESKEKKENNTMTQILRLQQICLDPKILNINAPSIKIRWLEEYLNRLLDEDEENNEYIIVFTNFSSIYTKHKFNINPKYTYDFLTGNQTLVERQNIIHRFQSRKIRILFANIKVASLGLTLDESTCTIFLDKSWDPVSNEQASFRMVDTKQKEINKPKLTINVICANSIDDKINDVLNDKKAKTNMIYELEKYLLGEDEQV